MEKIGEKNSVLELKKEVQRLMESLAADDDLDLDLDLGITDNAIKTLCALKELKLKQSDQFQGFIKLKNFEFQEPPHEFQCPISGVLMKNPVVAASGQTFEESSIRKWLKEGNTKCPQTAQLLPHTVLIPNHSIKNMIMNWCKTTTGKDETTPTRAQDFIPNATREHLIELLVRLSSLSDQTAAVRELRLLTARSPSVRALFGEINGSIFQLLTPPLIERCYSDAALYEDVVTTIMNLSTDYYNKTQILEGGPLAVSFLSEALMSKSRETRGHAAAALSSLSTVDSKKLMIGEWGAMKPLIVLLEEGHPLVVKDAASAILNLCTLVENRETALSEGVVTAVLDKIVARTLVDEMLEILARFSGHQRAVEEMEERGMVSCLVNMMSEDVSERSKENCVAIVYAMCFSDPRKLYQVEKVEKTLTRVARSGTSRARRKATGLLQRMKRLEFTAYTS